MRFYTIVGNDYSVYVQLLLLHLVLRERPQSRKDGRRRNKQWNPDEWAGTHFGHSLYLSLQVQWCVTYRRTWPHVSWNETHICPRSPRRQWRTSSRTWRSHGPGCCLLQQAKPEVHGEHLSCYSTWPCTEHAGVRRKSTAIFLKYACLSFRKRIICQTLSFSHGRQNQVCILNELMIVKGIT